MHGKPWLFFIYTGKARIKWKFQLQLASAHCQWISETINQYNTMGVVGTNGSWNFIF